MQAQSLSLWCEHPLREIPIPWDHVWLPLSHPDQAMLAWSLLQTLACKPDVPQPPPPQDSI